MDENATPPTAPPIESLGDRIDRGWADFRQLVAALPAQRLGERLGPGLWTRKQMLAHVAAWHDLASDRLTEFGRSGEKVPLAEDDDVVNARVARAAEGRTEGEVIRWMDDSFRRLRRLCERLSDTQLAAHEGWAAAVIASNTYEHYEDHRADVEPPPVTG